MDITPRDLNHSDPVQDAIDDLRKRCQKIAEAEMGANCDECDDLREAINRHNAARDD